MVQVFHSLPQSLRHDRGLIHSLYEARLWASPLARGHCLMPASYWVGLWDVRGQTEANGLKWQQKARKTDSPAMCLVFKHPFKPSGIEASPVVPTLGRMVETHWLLVRPTGKL